jgi:photosystem II stability/assembly factor-like uncharacterized protein
MLRIVLTAVTALAATGMVAVSEAGAAIPTNWVTQASYPAPKAGPSAISCPSTSVCVMVGGTSIFRTTDSGSTWSSESVPAGVTNLDSISCATTSDCIATGLYIEFGPGPPYVQGYVISTVDSGTTWTQQQIPDAASLIGAVTCASTNVCFIGSADNLSSTFLTTTNGGGSWSTTTLPDGIASVGVGTCVSSINCWLGAQTTPGDPAVIATNNGGSTWSVQSLPSDHSASTDDDVSGISCPSATTCEATATTPGLGTSGSAFGTTDGGATWSEQTVPTNEGLNAISCLSTTTCLAVGGTSSGTILSTDDGGATWAEATGPHGIQELQDVDCTTIACTVLGSDAGDEGGSLVMTTTDAGTSWSLNVIQPGQVVLGSVACASNSTCTATGGAASTASIVTTTNSGSAWNSQAVPGIVGPLSGVSCPSTSVCEAGTGSGILGSTDGGTTWSPQAVPAGTAGLTALSCASTEACVAVGSVIDPTSQTWDGVVLVTDNGGTSWADGIAPPITSSITGVSCGSAASCVAVTGNGAVFASTNGGSTWTTGTVETDSPPSLDAVTCTSATDCVAVGNSVNGTLAVIATTDGTDWLNQSVPDTTGTLLSVSCASATVCDAVGGPNILSLGDNAWFSQQVPSGASDLTGVSCPSVDLCYAVGLDDSGGSVIAAGGATPGPAITTTVLPQAVVGSNYSSDLAATRGTSPYTWSIANGSLPDGLSLDPTTGAITGIPTASGNDSFRVEVTDSESPPRTNTASVELDVAETPTITTADFTPSTVTAGQSVTYTATVSAHTGTPTGAVNFAAGSIPLCTATLVNGTGSCATTATPVGSNPVVGYYTGDTSHTGSQSEITTITVVQSPAFTIAHPPDTAAIGQPYDYTFAALGYPAATFSLIGAPAWLSIDAITGATSGAPPGDATSFSYTVQASNPLGSVTAGPFIVTISRGSLVAPVVGMAATPDGGGYWLVDSAGGVSPHGDALSYGSMAGQPLNSPIAHIVSTPDGKGYWLVAGDGGIFSFGDAGFFGSMGGKPLNAPVVDLAPTADGNGYWLVASDGGIFAFGDAAFHGSMGGSPLNQPVVGIAPDSTTGGYWLVASDGGIFAFDSPFLGSAGNLNLNQPVNGMTVAPDNLGYWFVASDGGVFAYGDATFHGSAGGLTLNAPIVGMTVDSATGGYWLVGSDGGVFSYGTPFYGSD